MIFLYFSKLIRLFKEQYNLVIIKTYFPLIIVYTERVTRNKLGIAYNEAPAIPLHHVMKVREKRNIKTL